jgi:hypothetical protein
LVRALISPYIHTDQKNNVEHIMKNCEVLRTSEILQNIVLQFIRLACRSD